MTGFSGEVHPYADAFPMLDDESLKALAEDIAANGLRHPIVLDPAGVLIDGRNRLRACELAGIEPAFTVHDGDPVRLVVSENMQRRDLTQGQKAHLAACLYNLYKQEDLAQVAGVPQSRIAEAQLIAEFASHLTDQVIARQLGHSKALDIARAAKAEAVTRETRWQEMETKAPDLLARIDEDFTFDMAWVAYQERDKERIAAERDRAEAKASYVTGIWGSIRNLRGHLASDARRELLAELDLSTAPDEITPEQIDQATETLQLIKERLWNTKRKGIHSRSSTRSARDTSTSSPTTS